MKILLLRLCAAALVAMSAVAATVHAAELHVVSSGGSMAAYKVLGPEFAAQTGNSLNTVLGPPMGKLPETILSRFARDELADVAIVVGYVLDNLIKQGKVISESRVGLVNLCIGMVMREGAARPDTNSPEALKHTLLHTRSIARSDSASGVYIERELFKKPGIEGQVKVKAKMIPCIPVAPVVATGDYEVGLQQVSELLPVPGAILVGKIPESLQLVTYYAASIPIDAQCSKEAKALLDYPTSPVVQADVKSTGLDSVLSQ